METETEVSFWLGEAVSNRAVNATQQNAESSRSHLILTLNLERAGRAGKLLLVDLAGSEKVKKTGATLRRSSTLKTTAMCSAHAAPTWLFGRQARRAMCWTRQRASTGL